MLQSMGLQRAIELTDWEILYHFNKQAISCGEVTKQRKKLWLLGLVNCGMVNIWET